ncbi:hypothetical protein M0804_004375 [Polistes exclamans]|nr:hypothetical protein M0804_004375 [Polistes exclamans]
MIGGVVVAVKRAAMWSKLILISRPQAGRTNLASQLTFELLSLGSILYGQSVAMVLHEVVIFYETNLDRGSSAPLCPPLLTHTHRRLRCIIPHSKQHIAYPP